uniref:peptidylprolyl isomerase n=2 Tax=Clastoptera arizonana TaxID=38151 RepID=A0A1B6EEJ4_9HEMI
MAVVIETTIGDITIDLYVERRPQTCKNFLKLCKIKYYNFCLFHSIQSNFLAQTGDPTGTGTGGESVFGIVYGDGAKFFEAESIPKIKHSKPGLLSMVNCGENMLGSQFFITLGADLQSLDEHCIFAEVVDGHDVLLKLNSAICDNQHRPYVDIRITHTVILQDPFEDPSGLIVPDMSPEPVHSKLTNGRIGADEKIDETEGLTVAEVEEMKQEREAKARATILEIVGDLPDAEMAPPENVLFVCKLNPVTNDDDLQTLFSRFGRVKSCEVIRDPKTGDSLQYAFVEFEDKKACEAAYFKMDNVLIDDRRIHVDFSQSVAKMRWRGKGRGVDYFDKDPDKERVASSSYRNEESRSHSSSRRDHYQDKERRHHSREADDKRRRRDDESDRYKSDYRKSDNKHRREERRRDDNSKKQEDRRYDDSKRREYDSRKRDDDNRKRDDEGRRRDEDSRRSDRRYDRKADDKRKESKKESERKRESEKYRDKKSNDDFVEKKDKTNRKLKEETNGNNLHVQENVVDDKIGNEHLDEQIVEKSNSNLDSLNENLTPLQDMSYQENNDDMKFDKEDKESINSSTQNSNFHNNQESNKSEQKLNKKLKRKQDYSEPKYKKKRRHSSSSESSSDSSDSSDSSSSSGSASSNYKHKGKHKMIVAKKYYQGGKLVKEIKKKRQHDSSDSESLSEDSSDSEYRRKKRNKKRKKVVVKVVRKRRKKTVSSDDSESGSSSSDENDRKIKKKKRRNSDKHLKKKRKHMKKRNRRSDHSSNSSDSESSEKKKTVSRKSKHVKEGSERPQSD